MVEIVQTSLFRNWLSQLTDRKARDRILARLQRAAGGNLGDWKAVGSGVSEMRVDHGPGYRLYFTRRGSLLVIILAGGTKRTQAGDIARAIRIAEQLEE